MLHAGHHSCFGLGLRVPPCNTNTNTVPHTLLKYPFVYVYFQLIIFKSLQRPQGATALFIKLDFDFEEEGDQSKGELT